MKRLCVYDDAGVDPFSLKQLLCSLEEMESPYVVVDRHYFFTEDWENKTSLILIPGGRDIPYHRSLRGTAVSRIRKFVESGGGYFGICAGAYFGCASIIFEKGSPLEVSGVRDLAFFPGSAIGPAYGVGSFHYETAQGARLASLELQGGNFKPSIYFNGGCLFDQAESYPDIQILAHYGDIPGKPAAIIACKVGRGLALLSGVHPEYCPSRMHNGDSFMQALLPDMHRAEAGRKRLLTMLLYQFPQAVPRF